MNLILNIAIFCTFFLINLGGLVHNTGSSLACPDWPLCFGQVMPVMEGGVLVEHSHRLLASAVGLLVIINLVLCWRKYSWKNYLTKVSLFALVLVMFQGTLGGLTVLYKLPTIVSTMHLSVSMLFFCTLLYLRWNTSHVFTQIHSFATEKLPELNQHLHFLQLLKTYSMLVMVLVYLQIILGAAIRHLGLGGACGVGSEHSFLCFDMIDFHAGFPTSKEAILHSLHRYAGSFIGAIVIVGNLFCLRKIFSLQKIYPLFRTHSALLVSAIFVVMLQVFLGIFTVVSNIAVIPTTLHLAGAALLLGCTFLLHLATRGVFSKYQGYPSVLSDFFSLTKPRLSGLVMFTCLLGMYLAPTPLSFSLVFYTLFFLYLVVAGACTINCYLEKDIDAKMQRTASRPLPSGRISTLKAAVLGVTLIVIGLVGLAVKVNLLAMFLAFIATFSYVALYTPLKKISPIALFIGAIPGAIPPLVGWVAATGSISYWGILLFSILFVWQIPHFLAIAIYHVRDYAVAGIKVFPAIFGTRVTKIRILFYSFLLMCIALTPFYFGKITSLNYILMTLLLGFALSFIALMGLYQKIQLQEERWARHYFFSTLVYLPLQLFILVFFS